MRTWCWTCWCRSQAQPDDELVQNVTVGMKGTKTACAELGKHRNKRLAHNDRGANLATEGMLLPSRQSIETALSLIRDILNAIRLHFREGTKMYADVTARGEADSLIACLHDGFRLRRVRRDHRKMSEAELRLLLDRRGPMEYEAYDDE